MVLMGEHHAAGAFQHCFSPFRVVCDAACHAVCFKVCLANNKQPVLVAKVVPYGIVGVVAGSHRIEIKLLHEFNFLDHMIPGYGAPGRPGMLMAVDPSKHYALAV